MKNLKRLAALPAFLLVVYACSKEDSSSGQSTTLVSSKKEVTPGTTVSFAVANGSQGTVARWSVTPDTNVVITRAVTWDQKNTITFNDTGRYVVHVELKKVLCDSAAAANPGMDTCINSGTRVGNADATIVVKN